MGLIHSDTMHIRQFIIPFDVHLLKIYRASFQNPGGLLKLQIITFK